MADLLDPVERSARGAELLAEICDTYDFKVNTPFAGSMRDFVFAEVWSREGLDRRSRYLVALSGAVLAGANADLVEGYIRGAIKGGHLSPTELREAALHLAVYGGWSRGQQLDLAISAALETLGLDDEAYAPIRAQAWHPDQRTTEGMSEFINVMTFPGGPSFTPYLEAINNFVFGEMWQRYDGLDQRARRWVTLVGVCESSTETPIKSHIHAAMASGNCTPAEMQEFVLQYGLHAGWPKASIVQAVVSEMSKKVAAGLPWNG